jgi:hypothetical protein
VLICSAALRAPFLRLRDADDDPGWYGLGFDVPASAQRVHPALEGATVEFGLFFDLAIRDRRAAEDPADRAMRS